MPPPSIVGGTPIVPTRPPHVRVPTIGPILRSWNIVRQRVAARAGGLVDDHHLGTEDARRRRRDRLAVALREVAHRLSIELVHDVVGDLPALVVSLVDDRAFLLLLRVEVAREVGVARRRRCSAARRTRAVRPTASRRCGDCSRPMRASAVRPRSRPARPSRARDPSSGRRLADAKHRLMIRRALEQRCRCSSAARADGRSPRAVVALGDLDAGRAERRAQVGIPVLAGVDVLECDSGRSRPCSRRRACRPAPACPRARRPGR